MDIQNKEVSTRFSFVVVGGLVILFLACVGYYFFWGGNDKIISLVGGATVASLFSILQVGVNWKNYSAYDKYRGLKVKEILAQRDDKKYYENLIVGCNDVVDIMGVSCKRFLEDFADRESNSHVLIDALDRRKNIKIRLLVAGMEYAPEEIKDNFERIKARMDLLKKTYGERFDYKYYLHEPVHSYVRVDTDILVGPHFSGVSSKHSPAIHLDSSSSFVEKYIKYFEDEWERAANGQG